MTAQGNLVELLAFLIDAQDTDVSYVMVAAGIHAAGNVQVDIAKIKLKVVIGEPALNGFRHGQGLSVSQRAVVAPGQQIMSLSKPMLKLPRPTAVACCHSSNRFALAT